MIYAGQKKNRTFNCSTQTCSGIFLSHEGRDTGDLVKDRKMTQFSERGTIACHVQWHSYLDLIDLQPLSMDIGFSDILH